MGQLFLRTYGPTALALLIVGSASTSAQDRWYVNHAATGGDNGTSWQDAFNDLQDAIDAAAFGDDIWVTGGTYRPSRHETPGQPRSATFRLPVGVSIFGGFSGNESAFEQRDWVANPTIVSGDLLGDDEQFVPSDCCTPHDGAGCNDLACETLVCGARPTCCAGQWDNSCVATGLFLCSACASTGNTSDNAYHVISSSFAASNTYFDGFVITAGNANVASGSLDTGGGAYLFGSSIRFRNCSFVENFALSGGGGVRVFGGVPRFESCLFAGNRSSGNGGVMKISASGTGDAQPVFKDCRFEGNLGLGPAGVYCQSGCTAQFIGTTFEGNYSATIGTAFAVLSGVSGIGTRFFDSSFRGNTSGAFGGVMAIGEACGVEVINSEILGNKSNRGGVFTTLGTITIANSTIAGNSATEFGAVSYIEATASEMVLTNSIVWGNEAGGEFGEAAQFHEHAGASSVSVDFSCVQGLTAQWDGVGNISADPLLFDLNGLDDTLGTSDDDVRLGAGSPCIDSGANDLVPADVTDMDGDGDLDEPMPFDLARSGRFQDDLNSPDTGQGGPPTVDMGAYEYGIADCNENDNPDIDDILSGNSVDCNGNFIPDECEGAECITASYPPPGSIDAGWPFNDEGELVGWNSVEVTFNADPTPISPGAFRVESIPPGDEPQVVSVDVSGLTVTLQLDRPIQPGTWTIITHVVSGTGTRIGYLPGDVNADRTSSPVDILRLIDVLNGVMLPPPEWSTDIDRSGDTNSVDVLREIDLLMNCDTGPCWLYAALPVIDE